MTATVTLNGQQLAVHEDGYSAFRVELTPYLQAENRLEVAVDNGSNRRVYPQKADFTFYGGIYRDVYLITVPREHFELGYYGTPAIQVTPVLSDDLKTATVTVSNDDEPNSRWYSGGGIYRDVTLLTAPAVHIAPDGLYLYTDHILGGDAFVIAQAEVENHTAKAFCGWVAFKS